MTTPPATAPLEELLDAVARQDTLGYLRARVTTPTTPAALCSRLGAETREVLERLGAEHTPAPVLAEVEAFMTAVTAEAFGWVVDGQVWPWSRGGQVAPRRPLGLLRDSTHQILVELDLKRLLPLLVERACALTHADAAFLAIVEPGRLAIAETRGLRGPLATTLEVSHEALLRLCSDRADYVTSAEAPWLAPLAPEGTVLLAPLWHQHELVGVIGCLGVAEATAGTAEAGRDLLTMLADLTAIAIRNAAHYRQIHEHAASLAEANARLKELDQFKDAFLATVSHERLRTPLNFILGFGAILQDGLEMAPLDAEQAYYLDKVLDGARQLLGLVNDLLDYSRIQAGELRLRPDRIEVEHWLSKAYAELVPLAEARGLSPRLELGAELPLLQADPDRLAQVLRNLVANAFKFTPAGGRLVLRAESRGERLRVEVEDSGIGIHPDAQDRLFKRFSQLEGGQGYGRGGTGLGLAISKSLIEAHGGAIGVRSPLDPAQPYGQGAGSAFWFELPLGQGAARPGG